MAGDGVLVLTVTGRLETTQLGKVWAEAARRVLRHGNHRVLVEAGGVTYCDSAGAALLVDLEEHLRARGGELQIRNFPDEFQPILDLMAAKSEHREPTPECAGFVESLGVRAQQLGADLLELISYTGAVTLAMVGALRQPHRVRWSEALRAAETAGVNSFPVVVLISGLLGLIMGFQSATVMHQFGADIFLADLLGLSLIRELGPLMTAVILTARSGSAFAAEIGTMKVNEEVDALTTMSIQPVRFLVVPRVIAGVLMTPILVVFANLAGLAGGSLVWMFTLDLPVTSYVNRLTQVIDLVDLAGGLAKSVVFGILVAVIGCIRGMQTHGGAIAVGESTTRAVVSGIVLIALADSVFAFLFHVLEI